MNTGFAAAPPVHRILPKSLKDELILEDLRDERTQRRERVFKALFIKLAVFLVAGRCGRHWIGWHNLHLFRYQERSQMYSHAESALSHFQSNS